MLIEQLMREINDLREHLEFLERDVGINYLHIGSCEEQIDNTTRRSSGVMFT